MIEGNSYEITTQPKNNNLDCMIDPKLRNFNRLFVLSFRNNATDSTNDSLVKYYRPLIQIKVFKALI